VVEFTDDVGNFVIDVGEGVIDTYDWVSSDGNWEALGKTLMAGGAMIGD